MWLRFCRKQANTLQQPLPDWLEHTHIVHTQLSWSPGSRRGLGRWWRYHRAVRIPTRCHLCSALGFLLLSSIHSAFFHSRNPSASYQLGSLSQGRRHLPGILDSVGYIPTVLSRATWWQGPFNTVGVSNEGLTQNATEKYTERYFVLRGEPWCLSTLLSSIYCCNVEY